MKNLTLFFLSVLSLSVAADNDQNQQESTNILEQKTQAEVLSFEPPVYPSRARNMGIEGWVVTRFVVTAEGGVENVEIVESSIEDYFDYAAIKSAKTRKFRPATSMGKPVIQANTQVRSIFTFSNSDGGVGKKFLRSYKKASKLINEDKLDQAKELIDKLDQNERRILAEVCYLDMLKAQYFAKAGDKEETLKYVERALVIADTVATQPIFVNLLRQAIVDNALANRFQKSIEHYQTLADIDKDLAPDDPIHGYMTQIHNILDGDKSILTKGDIAIRCKTCTDPGPSWRHTLNRNQFSIDSVQGELSNMKISCENSLVSIAYETDMTWTVNRDGGECDIRVIGTEGTTFRLIELPNRNS